ncbi:hypothetical protein HYDPIDRAFT_106633 [Hydnomerulius pinastri MD-312]|nr:hypothetical protein HYDPIDRAFT_106633 [Hydnomerulius pinastri MD-312]
MSSKSASSFAPYTLPPDDPSRISAQPATVKPQSRPWFPVTAPSRYYETSYQSGGIPSFNSSAGAVDNDVEGRQNQWETRYGLRVDMLAAFAYLLGPMSALTLLVLETHNDYVRFHAYQSALLTTPLLLVRILASLLRFPSWICAFFTIVLFVSAFSMATRAFWGASRDGLSRYHLPKLGPLADQWVSEE